MVGKWHVGHGHEWMTPWKRGFETFSGYLAGAEDHYTREWCMEQTDWCGVDYAEHSASFSGPTNATWGEYSGDLYLRKMSRIVKTIDPTKDSFVYFAPQHVHYPLQALQRHLVKFSWIKDTNRRHYAAMVASLDEIVGDVVALYRKNGLLENTIGFFVADNGGETRDGGNNWPLSGQKWTLLEGGLKATGFMFGGLVPLGKYNGLFHVTDILPTVMEAFNCPIDKKIDGYAQWGAMIKRKAFPRSELLHNIDPTKINKFANDSRTWSSDWDVRVQAALRKGPWKLITGDPGFTSDEVPEFPVPPPEWHQQEPYKNKTRGRISQITGKSADYYFENHRNKLVRLYKIDEDPTESRDISDQNISIVEEMLNILMKYNSTMVPPQLPDLDPFSNPKLHKGFWFPWISDNYNSKKQML